MPRKRRNTSSPEPDDESSSSSSPAKRRRPSASLYADEDDVVVNTNEQPQLHAGSGQVNAFPGLGRDENDDLFYGPALDGIDYLRMVRSEAKGVPSLLRAPAAADVDAVDAGSMLLSDAVLGRYYDGVYTAPVSVAVSVEADSSSPVNTLPPAQTRYYETLVAQFRLVQATLRCMPPLGTVEALGDVRPISFPRGSATARRAWERHVYRFDPHPVQLTCMDVASVFTLVRLLRRMMMSRRIGECTEQERRRIGAWVWAAVGKCPHRGELGSEEIAVLRDLANTVATIGKGEEADLADHGTDDDDEDEDRVDEIGDAIEAAIQARGAEHKEDHFGGMNSTAALVDMTLTIVGEVYGQRDLLALRPVWQKAEEGAQAPRRVP